MSLDIKVNGHVFKRPPELEAHAEAVQKAVDGFNHALLELRKKCSHRVVLQYPRKTYTHFSDLPAVRICASCGVSEASDRVWRAECEWSGVNSEEKNYVTQPPRARLILGDTFERVIIHVRSAEYSPSKDSLSYRTGLRDGGED